MIYTLMNPENIQKFLDNGEDIRLSPGKNVYRTLTQAKKHGKILGDERLRVYGIRANWDIDTSGETFYMGCKMSTLTSPSLLVDIEKVKK